MSYETYSKLGLQTQWAHPLFQTNPSEYFEFRQIDEKLLGTNFYSFRASVVSVKMGFIRLKHFLRQQHLTKVQNRSLQAIEKFFSTIKKQQATSGTSAITNELTRNLNADDPFRSRSHETVSRQPMYPLNLSIQWKSTFRLPLNKLFYFLDSLQSIRWQFK